MTGPRNPFRPTRFEHEQHPLIWISPEVSQLEALKSVYVAGTRGSGKTSLLKAVNWRERLYNPTVQGQLGDGAPDYTAIYFRLPDYLTSGIGLIDWEASFPDAPEPEVLGQQIFSQLIEMVSGQLLCEAVSALRAHGRFDFDISAELKCVQDLIARHNTLAKGSLGGREGLDDLSEILRNSHQTLNACLIRGQMDAALALLMPVQPGMFINDLVASLKELACSTVGACSPNFHFKICIDDCETLRPFQQRHLNTLVRSSKYPLFWIISFVSVDYDSTNTVQHNQTLSDADRTQIHLDEFSKESFRKLCEQVSLLRIYYSTPDHTETRLSDLPKNFFGIDDLLSVLSINEAIEHTAKSSLSSGLKDLIRRSEASDYGKSRDTAPIYETYVIERLGNRLADDDGRRFGAYIRRKQTAALLTIFSEFGLSNIPFIGANVVLGMSDNCIRDYLEIAGEIFDVAAERNEIKAIKDLTERKKPLSVDTQRLGVRRSSKAKFDGIRNNFERDWAEATRAVEFIGKLTAMLQSNHTTLDSLATPERGNFNFDLAGLDGLPASGYDRRDFILRLIKRCEADGLLRSSPKGLINDDSDSQELTFHLHRRFAPHFGFSYRGPYGLVSMPMEEFTEVCDPAFDRSVDDMVERAYAKISRMNPDEHPRLL